MSESEAAPNPVDHFPIDTAAIFGGVFVMSLIVDLIQHRGKKEVTVRDAAVWSVFWVAMSLAFYGWVVHRHGEDWGSMFLTGYVLEKTLSIDNLIVFIAIFRFFKIESALQHRILYLGILGAIVFRLVFVLIGTGFLTLAGPWALVIFGLFVGWAGVQMLRSDDETDAETDYNDTGLVRFFRRFYPVFPRLVGSQFFVTREEALELAKNDPKIVVPPNVKRLMTPAFVCLLVVEGSDLLFAFDSIPAVIAVTQEPILVYTAMIFAILGLRSLYFILVVLTKYLVHLEKAVIYILFYIALKMFYEAYDGFFQMGWLPWPTPFHVDPTVSMFVVLGMLAAGVAASFIWPAKE